ncbi:helix-turn-helix domain-containing protein [Metabacillus sp. HB246100]|uniref:helix-turn-helix domain-containing protein n=1 Tax=Bacillus weihaiensis TaxID=1547283 RepID=UPI0023567CA9|nr:helix-turn-helix domain-containing protein [Bacillus weihaiensis]
MNSKVKVVLHPVRLKIVQSLIGIKELNVQQLSLKLPDVPQATLYRHLNKLLEAEIIKIVKENQIRGTVEKFYSLVDQQVINQDDLHKLSRDEHLQLFLTFMTHLLAKYESYLNQEEIDLFKDGVVYREAIAYLSDDEFNEFVEDLSIIMKKVMDKKPSNERKARHIANIVIPESKGT